MNRYLLPSLQTLLALMLLLAVPGNADAQGRKYVKDQIANYGECRTVAITKRNGNIMIYQDNGWAANGCPQEMINTIKKLNNEKKYITDVHLTEKGKWIVLHGTNEARWNGITESLKERILEWNRNGDNVRSISFNDRGEWIAISEEHISASNSELQQWVVDGTELYGCAWTACVTDNAMVVVYENGYRYRGSVPQSLKDALNETNINVYLIKIAGDSWFFSDGTSAYQYYM